MYKRAENNVIFNSPGGNHVSCVRSLMFLSSLLGYLERSIFIRAFTVMIDGGSALKLTVG
jgi:hypothetical protein